MNNLKTLLKREFLLAFSNFSSIFTYFSFFLLALLIFIFSLGSEVEKLQTLHQPIVWVIFLFSLILISEHFVLEDFADGSLRELQFLGYSGELIFYTKSIVMLIVVMIPNLVLIPISSVFFKIEFINIVDLSITIILAAPTLVLISLLSAFFSVQIKKNRFFQFIIIIPFFIPIIIFATSPYEKYGLFDFEQKFFILFGLFLITLPLSLILGKLSIKEINN